MRSARKTLSNDWYGTSRLLARTFKSSSIEAGSRSEIVAVAHKPFAPDGSTDLRFCCAISVVGRTLSCKAKGSELCVDRVSSNRLLDVVPLLALLAEEGCLFQIGKVPLCLNREARGVEGGIDPSRHRQEGENG